MEAFLQRVLDQGGEGVVIRNPNACGRPSATRACSSTSPSRTPRPASSASLPAARRTRAASTSGRIGALITDYEGKRLELSGLTDAEREFSSGEMGVFASANPGVDMPDWFQGRPSRRARRSRSSTASYRMTASRKRRGTGGGGRGMSPKRAEIMAVAARKRPMPAASTTSAAWAAGQAAGTSDRQHLKKQL